MNEEFDKPLAGVPTWILNCPVIAEWCQFKGETYFGMLNYEASLKARKPMVDLSYCATRAFNGIVLLTVQVRQEKIYTITPCQLAGECVTRLRK